MTLPLTDLKIRNAHLETLALDGLRQVQTVAHSTLMDVFCHNIVEQEDVIRVEQSSLIAQIHLLNQHQSQHLNQNLLTTVFLREPDVHSNRKTMLTTRREHQHAPVSRPALIQQLINLIVPAARPTRVVQNTHGRDPEVQSMLTNTLVSSRSIADLPMQAFLVGTLMVLGMTTLLTSPAQVLHQHQLLAQEDRLVSMVFANAQLDNNLPMVSAQLHQ